MKKSVSQSSVSRAPQNKEHEPRRVMSPAEIEQNERLLALLQKATQGDHEAFTEIAIEVRGALIAAAQRIVSNFQDAEDAAQDALLSLWRDCQTATACLREVECVVGFLRHRAARCALAMLVRRRALKRGAGRVQSFDEDVRRELFGLYALKHGRSVVEVEAKPCDDPMRKMGMVHRLVSQIPADYVNKLDAYFFREEPIDAMATRYGVGVPTMKHALATGIQMIRHLASKEPEMMEATA